MHAIIYMRLDVVHMIDILHIFMHIRRTLWKTNIKVHTETIYIYYCAIYQRLKSQHTLIIRFVYNIYLIYYMYNAQRNIQKLNDSIVASGEVFHTFINYYKRTCHCC